MIFFISLLPVTMQALQQAAQSGSDSYLIQTAIANGGIGAILFVMWFITFKYNQKHFDFALDQNQKQFQAALSQNQSQFDLALKQIKEQHDDNIKEQRLIVDRLFQMMEKDTQYKEILTGVLAELKNQLSIHMTNESKEKQ